MLSLGKRTRCHSYRARRVEDNGHLIREGRAWQGPEELKRSEDGIPNLDFEQMALWPDFWHPLLPVSWVPRLNIRSLSQALLQLAEARKQLLDNGIWADGTCISLKCLRAVSSSDLCGLKGEAERLWALQ